MSDVSQWSTTAASNNSASPDGAPEGWAPSAVNDWGREVMAAVKRWYEDSDASLASAGSGNTYTLTTNSTHAALADMPVTTFRCDRANSGPATLNVDGLGAKAIEVGGIALVANDLLADVVVTVAYNATSDVYDLLSALPNNDASKLVTGTLPIARIAAGTVTNAKLADMVQETIKGRAVAAGTGAPTDLTAAQLAAVLETSRSFFGKAVDTHSTTYTTVAGDEGKVLSCTSTFTLTLLAAATAGAGFVQIITNIGTGVITVDGNAAETINGETSWYLQPQESITIVCDGSNWAGTVSHSPFNQVETITGAETVAVTDKGRLYKITSGTFTIDLPAAATAGEGFWFAAVNEGAGDVTIDPSGAETINGQSTISIDATQGETWALCICDGTNWNALYVPYATTSIAGIVSLAGVSVTKTGTNATRALTPNDLSNVVLVARFNGDATPSRLDGNPGTSGWTISHNATGLFTITHSLALADTNNLFITGTATGSGATQFSVTAENTNDFDVQLENGGSNINSDFSIICWLAE